jgi:gluconate 2-dehydrogenase subunit 3-like protein
MIAPGVAFGRRDFVRGAAILAAAVGAAEAARAAGQALGALQPEQAVILEALGDTLLPGAAVAGLAHFLDAQLLRPPDEALLTLRYVDVPPPYGAFYTGVAAALDAASRHAHGTGFAALGADERAALVRGMEGGNPPGWSGPPAPLAYFVLRSDALDVVYGTVDGFRRLDIPYMPHIAPGQPW